MIAPFETWHLGAGKFQPAASHLLAKPSVISHLLGLSEVKLCETILTDDFAKVLGVLAAVPMSKDTAEVLIFATEDQKRYPIVFAKCTRASLDTIREHFANIDAIGADLPQTARFLSWLGFVCEGPVERPEFEGKRMLRWSMRGKNG